ncbi:hypothetical protein BamMC406_6632 (plasmid) [Burkholderia ambifaria MC40-6]|uniref:Uncharacterized protein n=1 Tax=Burkholderia ambifaria (strain MC40-6) TaxID=398577 RepID=B1Z6H1_BURA4|nr:hypothetical protein [Burkholderia ambifaria]ACB69048.1 hypothetical protein BamMC406_6632 [Burkholderia ambifaria MC40-6]
MISRTKLDQLTEILRSELDKQARSRSASTGATPTGSAAPQRTARSLSDTLRSHIDQLIEAGITDEFQLTRAAVEHVLHRQFGDELVNDPSCQASPARSRSPFSKTTIFGVCWRRY